MVGFCQNPKKNLIIEHLVFYYIGKICLHFNLILVESFNINTITILALDIRILKPREVW